MDALERTSLVARVRRSLNGVHQRMSFNRASVGHGSPGGAGPRGGAADGGVGRRRRGDSYGAGGPRSRSGSNGPNSRGSRRRVVSVARSRSSSARGWGKEQESFDRMTPQDYRLLEVAIEDEESISKLVQESCVPLETIREERGFGPDLFLKSRFLLLRYPKSDMYMHMYPPAPQALACMFPVFFSIPHCDLGVAAVNPELRAMLTYASSAAHGCEYTMAHGIHMKSLFRSKPAARPTKLGFMTFDDPDDDLATNFGEDEEEEDPEDAKRRREVKYTEAEQAAINIALAMSAVPHRVTDAMRENLRTHFGEDKEQQVVMIATITGYLNRFMGIIDVPIEYESFKYCQKYSHEIGWKPGKHFKVESLESDIVEIDQAKRQESHGLMKKLSPIAFPVRLVKNIRAMKRLESQWMDAIPKTRADLKDFVINMIGFWPSYLAVMKSLGALRAFVYAITDIIFTSGREVPRHIKVLMCYICARGAHNDLLAAQLAFIAFQFGATESQIALCRQAKILHQMYANRKYSMAFRPSELALLMLAHACKTAPTRVTRREVHVLGKTLSHRAIIEAISVVSIYGVLQRWSAVYTPDRFEPIIHRFVNSPMGRRLSLPLKPNPVVFKDPDYCPKDAD